MNRRTFLGKALGWALTGVAGISPWRRAMAMGKASHEARLAIIIDDIGHSPHRAASFLSLKANLTYAVLPHLPHSVELAHAIHDRGHELLLHQPMEPFDRALDPGPGALFVGDPANHIESVMADNIRAVPFAAGVNNHMGSRFTSHGDGIRSALTAIKSRGLFFVDSLTSSQSKAYRTACRLHLSSARRDAFLDTHRHPQAILNRLYAVMDHALAHGRAIAIGHPYPETAEALGVFFSETDDTLIRMVPVSQLLS